MILHLYIKNNIGCSVCQVKDILIFKLVLMNLKDLWELVIHLILKFKRRCVIENYFSYFLEKTFFEYISLLSIIGQRKSSTETFLPIHAFSQF